MAEGVDVAVGAGARVWYPMSYSVGHALQAAEEAVGAAWQM